MMKVKCTECNWRDTDDKLLVADNPFDPSKWSDSITGCPQCYSINSWEDCCDEPECWAQATCGNPCDTGYRRTCYKHQPERRK